MHFFALYLGAEVRNYGQEAKLCGNEAVACSKFYQSKLWKVRRKSYLRFTYLYLLNICLSLIYRALFQNRVTKCVTEPVNKIKSNYFKTG